MKNMPPDSDHAEVRRFESMEMVIDTYQTPLLRYATHLLNNATLAQDAVQNALVKLFRQWECGMRPDGRLKSWLFQVVHNEAVDLIRSEERLRRHHEGHAAKVLDETKGGCYQDQRPDERVEMVKACMGVLTPPQRQVILLRMQQELSYEEISRITGQSVGYVGYLLNQAVTKLSEAVRKMEGGAL
jgi:RNA polymerase sigma-70 factor (ECF subfamily)